MKITAEGIVVGFEQYEPPSNYLYCKADPAHEQYEWLCENVFHYEIDGVKYFAPGATGRGLKTPENPQGPLINTSMAWKTGEQDIAIVTEYAEYGDMVEWEEVKKLISIDNMTAVEYQQYMADQLEERKKPEHIEFVAPCKDGVVREFVVDLADIVDTSAQYDMLGNGQIPHMLIHDKYHQVIPPQYSLEQAAPIIGIMTYVKKRIMLPVDALLQRLWALQEGFVKADVDKAVNEPLTQAEEDAILAELLAGATPELIALIGQLYGTV